MTFFAVAFGGTNSISSTGTTFVFLDACNKDQMVAIKLNSPERIGVLVLPYTQQPSPPQR